MDETELENARAARTFLTGTDPDFVGFNLATLRRSNHFDREMQAEWLGTDTQTLDRLALCLRPEPYQPDYETQRNKLANQFGLDSARLDELFKLTARFHIFNRKEVNIQVKLYQEEAVNLNELSYEELGGRLNFLYKLIEYHRYDLAGEENLSALVSQYEKALKAKEKESF